MAQAAHYGATSRDHAFGAARRHSRFVRILKYAVPLAAGLGVAAFAYVALFDPFRVRDAALDIGTLSVAGDTLTMELPRLTGFNKNHQSYNVTAKTATQKITAPGLIDLTDLEAVIASPDEATATLRAATGKFDSSAEFLTLRKAVKVTSTKGYSADLESAAVDFKAGTVKSDQAVKVVLESGVVEAGSLLVQHGGDVITFRGGVSTRFQRKPEDAKSTPRQNGEGAIQ